MKKPVSLFLSILIILSVMPLTIANAATASGTDGGLSWSLSDDGILTIRAGSGNRGADHTVSKKWYETNYTYSSPYHSYKDNIKKIVIENGVVSIGENAFYDLPNVTSVSVGDNVDSIGYHAFAKCTSLQGIALPAGCTWYWSWIFEDCTALKWAILPAKSNDGAVSTGTFKNCTSLETVYIGSRHTGIGDEAFNGCTSLKTIIWSADNVTVGTNGLKSVPKTCKFMGANVSGYETISNSGSCGDGLIYEYDYANIGLAISGSGTKISSIPWNDYKALIKSVDMSNISSSSYDICDDAFNGCINLTSVNFGSNLLRIGTASFKDCTSLKRIEFPNSMDTLGGWAFQNCTSLENVTLPNNCTWYWQYAFENCSSLKWAILPNTCNSFGGKISNGLFKGCTSLENVFVGSGHTGIGEQTFYDCRSLKGIIWDKQGVTVDNEGLYNVPSNMKTIGASIDGFASQEISGQCGDNMYYSYDIPTMRLTITGKGDMWDNPAWLTYSSFIKTVDFSSITEDYNIATSAFNNCSSIEYVDFGDYLRNIGWGAFMNCSSIRYIIIPNSVENIWGCAFENCTSIDSIDFRRGGTRDLYIREYAFKNLNHSTWWLNIPENTVFIGTQAFYMTNFNYVNVYAPHLTVGDDAFTTGYARFFGLPNSGFSDAIQAGKAKGYDWWYYCMDGAHDFQRNIVAPTCTAEGYDFYQCKYCNESSKSDYTEVAEHKYANPTMTDTVINYECSVCGRKHLQYDVFELMADFGKTYSTKAHKDNSVYFNARLDVNTDGYVNAKDFLLLRNLVSNAKYTYSNKMTTLDTSTTYQTVEGFGASAAWWSHTVGNWENIDEITELLYGKDKGIGMNIYRYNLGAGSMYDGSIYVYDNSTYCFLKPDGTYDWNADQGAMNALRSAQKANRDLKVNLFANSAPVYMTDNGKAFCSPARPDGSYTTNLSESNFKRYADYYVACAEHFIDEGYDVTNLSPINEPEFAWNGNNQEGCHWPSTEAAKFYNSYMIPAIQASSKLNGKVGLSVWESGGMDYNVWSNDYLLNLFSKSKGSQNENIRSYVDSVDTHSYWANTDTRNQIASLLKDSNYSSVKKVRCTEYCQMLNDGSSGVYGLIEEEGCTNGMGIEYGLALADIIYQDLTIVNAVEWNWWVACGRGVYPDALVYVNNNDHSDVQASKRLWCLGNYSKFIDEGAQRIKVTTGSRFGTSLTTDVYHGSDKNNYIEQSAYKNPDGSIVIVYINNSDTVEHTNFDSSKYSSFTTYVTSKDMNLEMLQNTSTKDFAIIPAKSVTTVVLK